MTRGTTLRGRYEETLRRLGKARSMLYRGLVCPSDLESVRNKMSGYESQIRSYRLANGYGETDDETISRLASKAWGS